MPLEEIAGKIAGKAGEKVPSWIERMLVPSLNEIKGELKAINTRIDSTNERIESFRNETKIEITSLDDKITSLRNEMKSEFTGINYRIDSLEKRIPVIEKMAALELKIAELEKRLAVA